MSSKLIFVYNADASLFAAASDFTKRILNPEEYECNLCMVTYGNFGMMKDEWKKYIDEQPQEKIFLHRDEFAKVYPNLNNDLPAIFCSDDTSTRVLVTKDEIEKVETVPEMIDLLESKECS